MLIANELFLQAVRTFRNVWIKGRYGGGKTLLSVAMAQQLSQKYHYSIYSNVPVFLDNTRNLQACDGTTKLCDEGCQRRIQDGLTGKFHAVVIYDEAWMSLGAGTSPKQIKSYLAYLRKMDVILMMPSVLPMARNSYLLWCERKINLGVLGLPLWVYEWSVAGKTAKEDGGSFYMWRPQSYFDLYDTHAQPEDLEGLFAGVD